jgi:toxin CcdB
MAKFDVYALPQGRGYLIDCQADLLSDLSTRFAGSLLPAHDAPEPAVRLHGNPVRGCCALFRSQGSNDVAREHDVTIGNAVDMLISGF